uniref:Vef101a n=1 Tax=Arundo donax TaxID=35708 RepID=A0A0A9D4W9_ARUDO
MLMLMLMPMPYWWWAQTKAHATTHSYKSISRNNIIMNNMVSRTETERTTFWGQLAQQIASLSSQTVVLLVVKDCYQDQLKHVQQKSHSLLAHTRLRTPPGHLQAILIP